MKRKYFWLPLLFLGFTWGCGKSTADKDKREVKKIENQISKNTFPKSEKKMENELENSQKSIETKRSCLCEFMIDTDFFGEIELNNFEGEFLKSIKNDTIKEKYIFGEILNMNNNLLHVEVQEFNEKSYGFLQNSEKIGFNLSAYSESEIPIFQELNGMKIDLKLTDELRNGFYQIIDCKNEWVKFKLEDKIVGWISKNWICGNPYSTCN